MGPIDGLKSMKKKEEKDLLFSACCIARRIRPHCYFSFFTFCCISGTQTYFGFYLSLFFNWRFFLWFSWGIIHSSKFLFQHTITLDVIIHCLSRRTTSASSDQFNDVIAP